MLHSITKDISTLCTFGNEFQSYVWLGMSFTKNIYFEIQSRENFCRDFRVNQLACCHGAKSMKQR